MNKEIKELVDLCKPVEHKNVSTLDTQIVELPIARLIPNSENFYDTTDLMDLKESIKEHGLLHPIAVTELGIIISGERRWRAIGQLLSETGDEQYSKIPAVVITAENPTEQEMMLIEANSVTRVLSSYEIAQQAKRYDELIAEAKRNGKDVKGRRRDIVAKMMKISPARVGRLMAILKNLNEESREQFARDEISESVAYELSKLPPAEQKRITSSNDSHQTTVETVRGWAKKIEAEEKENAETDEPEKSEMQSTELDDVSNEWREKIERAEENGETYSGFTPKRDAGMHFDEKAMREAVVVEQIENARKTASRHEKKVIDGLIEKYGTDYGYITYKIAEMLGVSMDSMWRVGEK